MKLFNAIAAAAVIGTSFIAANPAEARNGWIKAATGIDDVTYYVKIKDRHGVVREFYANHVGPGASGVTKLSEAHCSNWAVRTKGYPNWIDAMPGSVNEAILELVCS